MGWSLHNDNTVLKMVKIFAINFTGLDWLKWESTWLKFNWKLFSKMVTFAKPAHVLKYMLLYAVTISSDM